MLFRMLCKGSTGTIHSPHYILLFSIIKRKVISRASATVCYQIIFIIIQMLFMFLFIVSHVHYLIDGAPSQYKNFKNLINLVHYQDNHWLSAVWHFFAASHVKSSCDIGGTVKHLVTQSSPQNTVITF